MRAKDALSYDVVTCQLAERVVDVRPKVEASPFGFAFVVSESGIVLGRLRGSVMQQVTGEATAEDQMESGPSTVRADMDLDALVKRLTKSDLKTALVTTPDGMLLGVVRREDAETKLGGTPRDF